MLTGALVEADPEAKSFDAKLPLGRPRVHNGPSRRENARLFVLGSEQREDDSEPAQPAMRSGRHDRASERADFLATARRASPETTASAAGDGSGTGVSVRFVRVLPLTTPAAGSSDTVL